jgi:hypothetical protein
LILLGRSGYHFWRNTVQWLINGNFEVPHIYDDIDIFLMSWYTHMLQSVLRCVPTDDEKWPSSRSPPGLGKLEELIRKRLNVCIPFEFAEMKLNNKRGPEVLEQA